MACYWPIAMKLASVLLFGLFLTGCSPAKRIDFTKIKSEIPLAETEQILTRLASDEMEGRTPGTPGIEKAALYIENFLRTSDIRPFFNESYRDSFLIDNNVKAYNLVGVIDNKKAKNEYILLSAHYDHIGKSAPSTPGADSVYNGANDNASGVTAVLQIARFLARYHFDKKVLVVLFSGEEKGLLGSAHLAKRLKKLNVNVKYGVNLEMLGKTLSDAPGKVYLTGYQLSDFASKINASLGIDFITYLEAENTFRLFYRSDNYPFYEEFGIPSHTLSTFDFKNSPYYHHLKDEVAELDIANMNAVIHTTTRMMVNLLTRDLQIQFTKTSAP